MASLFTPHPLVLQTAYADLKRTAFEQPRVLVGTPGSVGLREVRGQQFLYRQFYDHAGKKRAEYIGPSGDPGADRRAADIRAAIDATNGLLSSARLLARQGYVRGDSRTTAVAAACASHELFRAGAVLVGSHAYGVLLNELGARAAAFRTEDVDLARDQRLQLADKSFATILADSLLELTPILDRKTPATSYKTPGRDALRVDLLVPTTGSDLSTRSVPELAAHATAVPYLRYLLADPIDAVMLGREAVIPLRVPRPERFVWHKMLVSQLRTATSGKREKDSLQAAVLFAVLAAQDADALYESFADAPAKTKTRAGAERVRELLAGQERATDLLRAIVS